MFELGYLLVAPCILGPCFLFILMMLVPDPIDEQENSEEDDPEGSLGESAKPRHKTESSHARKRTTTRNLPVFQRMRKCRGDLTPAIPYNPDESVRDSFLVTGMVITKSPVPDTDGNGFLWSYPKPLEFEQCGDELILNKEDVKMVSSPSYWGFDTNSSVLDYGFQKVREVGSLSHGTSWTVGHNQVITQASKDLAKFFGRKYCIFASSGTLACMSLVEHLVSSGGVIFMDSKSHGSFIKGAHLARVKVVKYPSGKYRTLESLIKIHRPYYNGTALLIVDGVNNMNGSIANLEALYNLCVQHDVKLIVDETHSLGVLGPKGRGIESLYNMAGKSHYICGSLGGTLATTGGFIVSDDQLIETMTLAPLVGCVSGLSTFSAACVSKGLSILTEGEGVLASQIVLRFKKLIKELVEHISDIHVEHCLNEWSNVHTAGTNVVIIYRDSTFAAEVAYKLRLKGYYAISFTSPDTDPGVSVLRLTVTNKTTYDLIYSLTDVYGEVVKDLLKACEKCSELSGESTGSPQSMEIEEENSEDTDDDTSDELQHIF